MIEALAIAFAVVAFVFGLTWLPVQNLLPRPPRADDASAAADERARRQACRAVRAVRVGRKGLRLTATGYVPLVWWLTNDAGEVIDHVVMGYGQLNQGEMPMVGDFDWESWIRQRATLRRVLDRMTF